MADDLLPQNGSPPAEGADAPPDDGFTPEERAQFAEMRSADTAEAAPAADGAADPAAGAAGAAGAAAAEGGTPDAKAGDGGAAGAAAGEEGDEGDDEGDGEGAVAVAGQPGGDPVARPPKRVAYGRFRRTEDRAKAAEAKLAEREQQFARADERLRILTEAISSPRGDQKSAAAGEDADDPKPDKEADVFAYLAWQERRQERLEKKLSDLSSGVQGERENDAVFTAYQNDTLAYRNKDPNFDGAYQHLMATRVLETAMFMFGKDLSEEGVVLTPEEGAQIKSAVEHEERALATGALKGKKSPAATIVAMARARGWRPPAAAVAGNGAAPAAGAANGAAVPGNGAAKPAAGAAKPSVKDEIARVKAGQDAALSLSNGGGTPANPLTATKLADMPQDQFASMIDNMTPEQLRRVIEGAS